MKWRKIINIYGLSLLNKTNLANMDRLSFFVVCYKMKLTYTDRWKIFVFTVSLCNYTTKSIFNPSKQRYIH